MGIIITKKLEFINMVIAIIIGVFIKIEKIIIRLNRTMRLELIVLITLNWELVVKLAIE